MNYGLASTFYISKIVGSQLLNFYPPKFHKKLSLCKNEHLKFKINANALGLLYNSALQKVIVIVFAAVKKSLAFILNYVLTLSMIKTKS